MRKLVMLLLISAFPFISFAQEALPETAQPLTQSDKSPAVTLPSESKYETLFKEYLNLVDSFAKEMNYKEIEKISQQFVETHKNFYIYEIYIWNNSLHTKNNLFFHKSYIDDFLVLLVYPKINYLDPKQINVSRQEQGKIDYMLIEYQPELVSYRMVIILNKS